MFKLISFVFSTEHSIVKLGKTDTLVILPSIIFIFVNKMVFFFAPCFYFFYPLSFGENTEAESYFRNVPPVCSIGFFFFDFVKCYDRRVG